MAEVTINAAALVQMSVHGLMCPRGFRRVALTAYFRRGILQPISKLVHLGIHCQIQIGPGIPMAFVTIAGSCRRGNAMGDQLEGLIRLPGICSAFADVRKTGDSRLVKAAGLEHLQDVEVGLAGAAVDRVLGRMHLEWIEFPIVDVPNGI